MAEVDSWNSEQVSLWLKGLDQVCSSHAETFLQAGITGRQLLCMNHHDLEHLGVEKFGHQELILEGIELLSRLHYEVDTETLQSIALKLSCQVTNLQNELSAIQPSPPPVPAIHRRTFSLTILSSMGNVMQTLKMLVSWLDRSPFESSGEYMDKRRALVQLGLDLLSAVQQDNNNASRTAFIATCQQLEALCGSLVRENGDPLTIQPASLETVLVRKPAEEELGLTIDSSNNMAHVIEGIKKQSAADICGKFGVGDEVVKVNDQVVVGWHSNNLVSILKDHPTEVTLTLKKRPHHTNPQGIAAQRKRLANKLKQSARRSKKVDRNSRAALTAELLLPVSSEGLGSTENDSESDADLFLADAGIDEDVQESKQRRATVSGGSPTIKRPTIKITQFTGRPKSDTIILCSPSSEESVSTESLTPDGLTTPDAEMKAPPTDDVKKTDPSSGALTATGHVQDTDHSSQSVFVQRYHDDAIRAAQEIPGDNTSSLKLMKMTRLLSNEQPAGESMETAVSPEAAADVPHPRTLCATGSYTVNIVAGVPQKVPIYSKSPAASTQSNTSILRTKKTVRKVGSSRRISCKDLGAGDCQGWLWKKRESAGVLHSRWVKRWVVLKTHNLYFYKHHQDEKAKGVVYLPGFLVSPAPEIKAKKFAFKAHHSGTTFYFAAERQDDMSKWMNKLGLATLSGVFDPEEIDLIGGVSETGLPHHHEGYYSESDDEDSDALSVITGSVSDVSSLRSQPGSIRAVSPELQSPPHYSGDSSKEGMDNMESIYRKIVKADLGIDGACKKQSRASLLQRSDSLPLPNSENVPYSRKLSSLQRTLKAKQAELEMLNNLLGGEDEPMVTKEVLTNLRQNPTVLELIKGEDSHIPSSSSSLSGDSTEVESLDGEQGEREEEC